MCLQAEDIELTYFIQSLVNAPFTLAFALSTEHVILVATCNIDLQVFGLCEVVAPMQVQLPAIRISPPEQHGQA